MDPAENVYSDTSPETGMLRLNAELSMGTTRPGRLLSTMAPPIHQLLCDPVCPCPTLSVAEPLPCAVTKSSFRVKKKFSLSGTSSLPRYAAYSWSTPPLLLLNAWATSDEPLRLHSKVMVKTLPFFWIEGGVL